MAARGATTDAADVAAPAKLTSAEEGAEAGARAPASVAGRLLLSGRARATGCAAAGAAAATVGSLLRGRVSALPAAVGAATMRFELGAAG